MKLNLSKNRMAEYLNPHWKNTTCTEYPKMGLQIGNASNILKPPIDQGFFFTSLKFQLQAPLLISITVKSPNRTPTRTKPIDIRAPSQKAAAYHHQHHLLGHCQVKPKLNTHLDPKYSIQNPLHQSVKMRRRWRGLNMS